MLQNLYVQEKAATHGNTSIVLAKSLLCYTAFASHRNLNAVRQLPVSQIRCPVAYLKLVINIQELLMDPTVNNLINKGEIISIILQFSW